MEEEETIMRTLSQLNIKDLQGAKAPSTERPVLPAGEYNAKFMGVTEEETYSYFKLQINNETYNFFYNLYLKDSEDLDANILNWIKSLATITTDDSTSLLAIVNSAIGSTYKIKIYNYVSKTGKNAGKTQHAIDYKVAPQIQAVQTVETEELDLPF